MRENGGIIGKGVSGNEAVNDRVPSRFKMQAED
jgi:hypothetical protein